MQETTLEQLPRKIRDLYEKSMAAIERGNLGYAVDMLKQVLQVAPNCLLARKNLHVALLKVALAKKPTAMTHQLSSLAATFSMMSAQGKLKKDPAAALAAAEKFLESDPLNPAFIKFYAQAAEAADMLPAAAQFYELVKAHFAKDVPFLQTLAGIYSGLQEYGSARECCAAIVALRPNDQAAIKQLKDVAALATIRKGNWEEKGDFRKKLADKDLAQRLEQANRSVKGEKDTEALIKDRLADIEREPQNMNFRRALADLYVGVKRYDEALQALDDAIKAVGRPDPQIERTASAIKVKKFDAAIEELKAAGDAAGAAAKEQERADFIYQDALDMVKRYPNDLQFRYELGVQYYERGMDDNAIEEFQLAQRNPQRRTRALYYLALAFARKGQLDLAFDQLKKASSEITLMDETKKDIVYEMGVLADQMGRRDEAVGYFKEIYAVDIKYRDVAQRISASYQRPAP